MSVLKFKDPVTKEWREINTIVGAPGKDGKDGAPGKDGIDGKNGVDGKDYVLTANDKAEIAQLTLAAMPQAEEGAY